MSLKYDKIKHSHMFCWSETIINVSRMVMIMFKLVIVHAEFEPFFDHQCQPGNVH